MKDLEINAELQIAKPRIEVFDAIVDPVKMSNYFIASGAEKMEQGKSVIWRFPEFPDMKIDVKVTKLKTPEVIIFEWEGSKNRNLEVKIELEERSGNQTLVKLTEGKMKATEEGITWFGRNTEGWANFLACMKAYLEFGINLRKGGYDFKKKPE
ncbi:MAG TPA: SRPBCC domain-containing protein [Christiangramia sp.]|nr:SRPBCC domain-containing protein [Christiangramia sp.]